jgi:hypothetical protein
VGAQGSAVLDFGAFPGSSVVSVDVNSAGIVSTSALEAWIRPVASSDHTDADHIAAPMKVVATYLSDNNMRIYGINTNDIVPPVEQVPALGRSGGAFERKPAPMLVGQFNVWWVWN